MAKKTYFGVDNASNLVSKAYIGIDNVARKITKMYRGVDGVAKLVYSSEKGYLYGGTSTIIHSVGTLTDEYSPGGNVYTLSQDAFVVAVTKYDDVPLYVYLDKELIGTIESSGSQSITLDGGASTLFTKGTIEITLVSESTYLLGRCGFSQTWQYGTNSKTAEYFYSHSSPTSATLSDNIVGLNDGTFQYSTFTEIDLPPSIVSIGQEAFLWCELLETIDLSHVTEIGKSAFSHCYKLIPHFVEGLKTIGDGAYFRCNSIVDLVIPDSVEYIGDNAFSECGKLATISKTGGNASLGKDAFYQTINLVSAHIEGISTIGESAFEDLDLSEVVFSNTLSSIGDRAFANCTSLSSITLPDSVNSIGSEAFIQCSALTSINIPSGLSSIEVMTFRNCTNVYSIVIPKNVTSIKAGAFSNVPLSEITFKHSVSDTLEIHNEESSTNSASDGLPFQINNNMATIVYHRGNASVLNYKWSESNRAVTFIQE